MTFAKNEYVIRDNQSSQQLYQVVSGRTRIEKEGIDGVLGYIGPDDGVFGQIVFALLDPILPGLVIDSHFLKAVMQLPMLLRMRRRRCTLSKPTFLIYYFNIILILLEGLSLCLSLSHYPFLPSLSPYPSAFQFLSQGLSYSHQPHLAKIRQNPNIVWLCRRREV